MSERAFVCQLTLLNIDTYSNILIESSINTNEMYSRINEKRIYVIDITFSINGSIFSGNEQQKVYSSSSWVRNSPSGIPLALASSLLPIRACTSGLEMSVLIAAFCALIACSTMLRNRL